MINLHGHLFFFEFRKLVRMLVGISLFQNKMNEDVFY